MSMLPLFWDIVDELDRQTDFGFGIHPRFLRRPALRCEPPMVGYSGWPMSLWSGRQLQRSDDECAGQISPIGKDGFQVSMDVTQFKPNELNVKVVDNCVMVEGKHEEREDNHGYISRHFVRRYALPKGYDADKVQSTLSSDGVLTVSIPKPAIEEKKNERTIQIQQTGPAHLNVKENPKEDAKEGQQNGK